MNLLNNNPAGKGEVDEEAFASAVDVAARETADRLKGSPANAAEVAHSKSKILELLEPLMDELPLGSTIAPQRGVLAALDSEHLPYTVLQHPGRPDCRHDLHVDDGIMYEVSSSLHKVRRVRAVRSSRERVPQGFTQRTTWHVPCPRHGAFEHSSLWLPNSRRGTDRKYRDKRSGEQRALHSARVPAPGDEGYRMHYLQSAQEGHHRWVKDQLHVHGRASSWRPGKQLLDFISSALVNNSQTWQRSPDAVRA